MKKLLFILVAVISINQLSAGNKPDSIPAHLAGVPFPDFKLLLADSSTVFYSDALSKKKNIILIGFSPECEHCRHQTEELLKHIKEFKEAQIVMSTTLPFEKMKAFYNEMNIAKYKNIIMGRDVLFYFPKYFRNGYLPGIAVYNKKRTLLNFYDGGVKTEELIKLLN